MAFGLSRFDLTTLTRRLELPEISADPAKPLTLILRFLGIGNRDWESWRFARDAAAGDVDQKKPVAQRLAAAGDGEQPKKPTAQRLADNRADMRDTLSMIGLVGWENVLEDGTPVVFTADAGVRFSAELHNVVPNTLSKIADFASTRSNFRIEPVADPVDLGKE